MIQRRAWVLRGRVQGGGMRPWVAREAAARGLTGFVRNDAGSVRVEAQGPAVMLDGLEAALAAPPPPLRIDAMVAGSVALGDEARFAILPGIGGQPAPAVVPDQAICAACRDDLRAGRRADYPLLGCAACGPRWSVVQEPPWDRERTAMAAFPPCPACGAEYADPADRRYHAEGIACAACGPRMRCGEAEGREAIAQAVACLADGGIVGLKGLAGWQLLCDASDPEAVARLRARKRRPDKPLAVLFADVQSIGPLSETERELLSSPAAPVVLVPTTAALAPGVCGGRARVGAMLPATGAHVLLAERGPLVCTSGNRSGEPVAADRLPDGLADLLVDHDRPILQSADDSVARVIADRPVVLRRARGLAPDPFAVPDGPVTLALGAQLAAAPCLAIGEQAVLAPFVGDLGGAATDARLEEAARQLVRWFGRRPEIVACDLHPELTSTRIAERLAAQWGAELVRVPHHAAHVAAVAAEHGLDGLVSGIAWDGLGLGPDGGWWGGHWLTLHGAALTPRRWLRPFAQPGGEACARTPARSAIGLLAQLDAVSPGVFEALAGAIPGGRADVLLQQREPRTHAVGRLLAGLAALCGLPLRTTYEGHAEGRLEDLAEAGWSRRREYVAPWTDRQLDWRPLVEGVIADRADGVPVERIAAGVHAALVSAAVTGVDGAEPVVLAGGCFVNGILRSETLVGLTAAGHRAHAAERLPCGDGGLAFGQAVLARRIASCASGSPVGSSS